MGLGSMVAVAAVSAASKQAEMTQRLKGRTPDQQKVIKYFYRSGGCLSKPMSDEEYESMVMGKVKSIDFKQKALDKIGLDESQVNEVSPVHFEDYFFDEDDPKKRLFKNGTYSLRGNDNVWRSSAYQVSWIFFSSSQIYVYQYTFNMDEDGKKETTEEYFYKDVTNFSTASDTAESTTPGKTGCTGNVKEWVRSTIETNKFQITVPGDKFYCSMKQNDYAEKAVQGMKAKLREKKGA